MSSRSIARIALLFALPFATALSSPGFAQSGDVSPALARARQMYDQVEELVSAGKYEEALPLMRATYLLKEHWQNAAMLGLIELKTGRYRDTAEHSAIALRTATARCLPETKAKIASQLAAAKAKVTSVTIKGVDPGSKVLVDGKLAGNVPLADPLFVEPGEHLIEVQNQAERPHARKIKATAGVDLVLDYKAEPSHGGVAPGAATQPSASAAIGGGAIGREAQGRPSETPSDSSSADVRKWIGIGGGAATLVALGVGIGFWARSRSLISSGDQLHDQYAPTLSKTGCNGGGAQCAEISDKYNQAHSASVISTTAAVAAGVLGAATLAAVLLWPTEPQSATAHRVWAAPQVGGHATGFVLGGDF